MRITYIFIMALGLGACGSMSYKPIQANSIKAFSENGCGGKGDRATLAVHVKTAMEDSMLLWDGTDSEVNLIVRFPDPSLKDKFQDAMGKNKYEQSNKLLKMIVAEDDEIEITLECKGKKIAPEVVRYTYDDEGDRKTFEF